IVLQGIELLDVKNQLLLQYLTHIVYLLLLKNSGRSIEGDEAIGRLVELRVIMERIRPIEQKLKYQIDKLIKIAITGIGNENDPSHFKANPANMISKSSENDCDEADKSGERNLKSKEKKSGVYVPPKLAAVHYDGDITQAERKNRLLERARKHALNSSVMQELKEEYLDTPTEIINTNSFKQKQNKQEKYRQEYEENYFTRLPVTKEDRKRAKRLSTLGSLGSEITKFEDISALDGNLTLKTSKKRKLKGKSLRIKKGTHFLCNSIELT
ncbi:hypothetical protein AAG570_001170, partial [Ranatra chinensis]